ncbi:MAG TPA: glycoside hydrolase family 6 protein [Actinomycetes bacterium]|jgi:cellulase/cellobiase CelA1
MAQRLLRAGIQYAQGFSVNVANRQTTNPRRQALGQAPTSRTTLPGLAALLWVKLPGESDGICGGETN